jgi:hypothetical protein
MDQIDPDLRESTRKLLATFTDEGSKREVLKVARMFTEQIERAKKGRRTSHDLSPQGRSGIFAIMQDSADRHRKFSRDQ